MSLALAVVVLAFVLAPIPARAEYSVVPGSIGNGVHLSLDCPPDWMVTARILSLPNWMRNAAIASTVPGQPVRLRFDVDPGAAIGTGGTLVLALTARDGRDREAASVTRRLPMRVREAAPEIQASTRVEECCVPSAGIEGTADLVPNRPVLLGAVPNPWSTGTAVRFGLPRQGAVRLKVLDVSGRVVREILSAVLAPGYHELRLEGLNPRGEALTPGLYFYKLSFGDWAVTGKTLLLR